jgi:hypothetical protein
MKESLIYNEKVFPVECRRSTTYLKKTKSVNKDDGNLLPAMHQNQTFPGIDHKRMERKTESEPEFYQRNQKRTERNPNFLEREIFLASDLQYLLPTMRNKREFGWMKYEGGGYTYSQSRRKI